MSAEQAVGLEPRPVNKMGKKAIMINHAGVTKSYESITKAAEDHNLSMKIVSKRLRSGWTNEQALGLDDAPIHESQNIKGIDVVIEGVTVSYRTLTEAAVTDRPESP